MIKYIYILFACLFPIRSYCQNSLAHSVSNYSGSQCVFINPSLLSSSKLKADLVFLNAKNFNNDNKYNLVGFKPPFNVLKAAKLTDLENYKDYYKLLNPGQKLDVNSNSCIGGFLKFGHKTAIAFNYIFDTFYVLQNTQATEKMLKDLNDTIFYQRSLSCRTLKSTFSQHFENEHHNFGFGLSFNLYESNFNKGSFNQNFDFGLNYQFSKEKHLYKHKVDNKSRYSDSDYIYNFRVAVALFNYNFNEKNNYNKPQYFNVLVDFYLKNNLYFTVNSSSIIGSGLSNNLNINNKDFYHNYLCFQPRCELRYLEIGFPVTYFYKEQYPFQNGDSKLSAGINLSIANLVYFGTNNVTDFIQGSSSALDNFYVGFRLPFHTHDVRDRDKDGVSDKKDACPDDYGLQEFKGCPDTDEDGFPDILDKCPDLPGRFDGCPDTDNDGFPEDLDNCPTIPGKLQGCPDTDHDNYPDLNEKDPLRYDQCPTTFGNHNGCPDSDGDGFDDENDSFPQNIDHCKKMFGKIQGCPDDDLDGVSFYEDSCRNDYGPNCTHGCPDLDFDCVDDKIDLCVGKVGVPCTFGCPDSDGDCIADKEDKCPNLIGTMRCHGCPEADIDKDGIIDCEDNCPNIFGLKEHNGCKHVDTCQSEIKARQLEADLDNLTFVDTLISQEGKLILDSVFNLLANNEFYKLTVIYCDSNERVISRLNAVKYYFQDRNLEKKLNEVYDQSLYQDDFAVRLKLIYKIQFLPTTN